MNSHKTASQKPGTHRQTSRQLDRFYKLEASYRGPLSVTDRATIKLLAMAGRGGSY